MKNVLFIAISAIVAFYAGQSMACPLNKGLHTPTKQQEKQDMWSCKRPATNTGSVHVAH